MTNDPSKMVGGADAFICDVVSNNGDGTWDVDPRIVEIDGTNHPTIKVNAVGGIKAQVGDVVLVETVRNNLDDKKISRFYPPTEANGRIIAVAKPVTQYVFDGDYKFEGDFLVQGNLEVTQNLQVGGDLTVDGSVEIAEDLTVDGDAEVGGELTVDGEVSAADAVLGNIRFSTHTHTSSAPGVQTGPAQGPP